MRDIRKLIYRINNYMSDASVDIKDRTFVLFSGSVLVALFLAIPAGLIMKEPLSATISTAIGAIFFTIYVVFSFKKKRIERAKIAISIILVFIFLPAMFFTNGGVEGGAPIWLLLGTIYIAMTLEGRFKIIMFICEAIVMIVTWLIGYKFPELVTRYSTWGNYFDTLMALFIVSGVIEVMMSFQTMLYRKEEENKNVERLFTQTAMALVNAIDAKDKYTHGHSARVAEYSRKIAEMACKSQKECDEIYYVALLHDVGKIGISESIINKQGKLTDVEYDAIKQHAEKGGQILQNITVYPYLSIGARYHHERFDGRGYPHGLKGTDIPEIARIISVADAYDAMTSSRSYREPIPQEKVREEFVKCLGTQFDPKFASIMIHIIDEDTEYKMKEKDVVHQPTIDDVLSVRKHRDDVSNGIPVNEKKVIINIEVKPLKSDLASKPSLILFDALDRRYHSNEKEIQELYYYEYCEVFFDGRVVNKGVRKIETRSLTETVSLNPGKYVIEASRYKDHTLIKISGNSKETIAFETIIAMPDNSRYSYIGFTGENCIISDITIDRTNDEIDKNYIPRIAEAISFIEGPEGDVPNVQVDGYRTDSSDGIPLSEKMEIAFHTKSLPTARLVWHCPMCVIYSSKDGKVNGKGYTELALMRLDGENWKSGNASECTLTVDRHSFSDWDNWKQFNKDGYDCTISFERSGNRIVAYTKNDGIAIRCATEVKVDFDEIYVALTGDQIALTDIRIKK